MALMAKEGCNCLQKGVGFLPKGSHVFVVVCFKKRKGVSLP